MQALATFYARCPLCASAASTEVVSFPTLRFVRCAECRLIYKHAQSPSLAQPYEDTYFKTNRAGYLKRWDHRVRKCARQLLVCLELAPHARRVLDVGCSAGYVLEAARRLKLEPTGVDLSKFASKLSQSKGFNAACGSLMQLPFADGSFDIVTLKHTLEHVEKPLDALAEIARVLRPGGVAFVIVPDADYWKLKYMPIRGRSFRPDRRGWQHHVYYDVATLERALATAGLQTLTRHKAIARRRLTRGWRAPWEWLRYGFLVAWTTVTRVTRTRREIQLIARKAPAPALPES